MTFDELRPIVLAKTMLAMFLAESELDPELLTNASLEALNDPEIVSDAAWDLLLRLATHRLALCGIEQCDDPIVKAAVAFGGEYGPFFETIASSQKALHCMVNEMLRACQKKN